MDKLLINSHEDVRVRKMEKNKNVVKSDIIGQTDDERTDKVVHRSTEKCPL